ncbi:MAG: hypothetical protein GF315_13030 [candidate division Zixibacteria bacterium]|nr:hypothetical protein [candidate division Zixibacteria bacterium]
MIELDNLKFQHSISGDIKERIRAYFNGRRNGEGLLALCGAASALALKDYNLYSLLAEISFVLKFPARSIYEGILQCYLFLGFPRAIEGLRHLKDIFRAYDILLDLPYKDYRTDYEADGFALCKVIYADKYPKLMEKMNSFSPELATWMIREGYGKVLSRPGLETKHRELITVSALISEDVPNQLSAHIKGAYNTGATEEEFEDILSLLSVWLSPNHTELFQQMLAKLT